LVRLDIDWEPSHYRILALYLDESSGVLHYLHGVSLLGHPHHIQHLHLRILNVLERVAVSDACVSSALKHIQQKLAVGMNDEDVGTFYDGFGVAGKDIYTVALR